MAQVVEILPHGWQEPIYPAVNTMAADDLGTQVVRSSAVMVLTKLSQNIPAATHEVLIHTELIHLLD